MKIDLDGHYRPELEKLKTEAVAKFNAMTPAEQQRHRALQVKSWVIGEMMLDNPSMTRDQAEQLYEKSGPLQGGDDASERA